MAVENLIEDSFVDNGGKDTVGLIIGSRGCFQSTRATEARDGILEAYKNIGVNVVVLPEEINEHRGMTRTLEDGVNNSIIFGHYSGPTVEARKKIKGIVSNGAGFNGDESSTYEGLKQFRGRNMPILLQASPDRLGDLGQDMRFDDGCGKYSIAYLLGTTGIKLTPTYPHVQNVGKQNYADNLAEFLATCKVVHGLTEKRIGRLGDRPRDFTTMAINEPAIMSEHGTILVQKNLIEIVDEVTTMESGDPEVKAAYDRLNKYNAGGNVPEDKVLTQAKLYVAMKNWIEEEKLDGVGVQCWIDIEQYLKVTPCAVMTMLIEDGTMAACEVDVMGAMSMQALAYAGNGYAGLLDIANNKFSDEDIKKLRNDPRFKELINRRGDSIEDVYGLFHCGILPACYNREGSAQLGAQTIMEPAVGVGNAMGPLHGDMNQGEVTHLRMTIGADGTKVAYMFPGIVEPETAGTFGSTGLVYVKGMNDWMDTLIRQANTGVPFQHHVAIAYGGPELRRAVGEALTTYLGYELITKPQERIS